MISLQRRLGLGIGVGLLLVLGLVWLTAGLAVRHLSEDYVASRLEHDAESLLAALTANPEPALDPAAVSSAYLRPYSGHYYVIKLGGEAFRSRSLWDEDLPLPATGRSRVTRLPGPRDQSLLVFQRRYELQGVTAAIAVAEDLAPLERHIDHFQRRLALLFAGALAAALLGQYFVVRRGLAPLEALRAEVKRIDQGEAERLAEQAPAEVAPLVNEINRLLRLTAQRLARSRHALGDLAHALKTPLALILQTAEDRRLPMSDDARQRLLEETARIHALVDRELKRARLAGAPSPGRHFRPQEELPALAAALRAIYADRGLEIAWSAPAHSYSADRDDMLELLGNLLDNAAKWANGRVRITLHDTPALAFTVEDDGPGCPPERLAELTARGVRLDEKTPGAGLGLSIARAIVEDYSGELRLGRSPTLGGFLAEVRLP